MTLGEILLTLLKVFVTGGAICTIAQLLINYTKITAGKILVIFLLSGVVLQAVGLYEYIVKFGSAGATVPISGFGYLLAKGAKESLFKAITGGITSAGMGITAAIVFGYIFSLIFKPRSKKN